MTRFALFQTRYCETSGCPRCWSIFDNSAEVVTGSLERNLEVIGTIPLQAASSKVCALNTLTDRQLTVLYAAKTREAGGHWTIERIDGLDCIDRGWLTEDYYLTDAAKHLLQSMESGDGEMLIPQPHPTDPLQR
jgi:hypothetical protein